MVILGSRVAVSVPGTSSVCHGFDLWGPPHKFDTRDLHLLLGVSTYVSDRAGIFSSTSIALDLEARWQ